MRERGQSKDESQKFWWPSKFDQYLKLKMNQEWINRASKTFKFSTCESVASKKSILERLQKWNCFSLSPCCTCQTFALPNTNCAGSKLQASSAWILTKRRSGLAEKLSPSELKETRFATSAEGARQYCCLAWSFYLLTRPPPPPRRRQLRPGCPPRSQRYAKQLTRPPPPPRRRQKSSEKPSPAAWR